VRSIGCVDSSPEREFAIATISRLIDSRNRVDADVDIPAGGAPALVTFSRPYFRGYKAQLADRKLQVQSYRGLFPVVELPAGSHGRLTLTYRPWWLTLGGAVALVSGVVLIVGLLAALRNFIRAEA
jgi:uncharacterized membrane protein YfhO